MNYFIKTLTIVGFVSMYQHVDAKQLVPDRFVFFHNGNELHFPYASNIPIDEYNQSVTTILIAIHGLGYNPMDYLTAGINSAAMANESENTLVIAPHFMREEHLPLEFEEYLLFWEVSPFWGSHRAYRGTSSHRIWISGYKVLDCLLGYVSDMNIFPNLKNIIVAGQSAGGQLVNRYAASNRYDVVGIIPTNVQMRYIIMAPSSYLYFDESRVVHGTETEFSTPSYPPEGYNKYGYGMENLYAYLAETGEQTIREQYANRYVFYLIGSDDNDPDASDLDTSPPAMLQGAGRLSRSLIYYNYLGYYYGSEVHQNHRHFIVSGMGHSGPSLMQSREGILSIYDCEQQGRLPADFVYPNGVGLEDFNFMSNCWLENVVVNFDKFSLLSQYWLMMDCGECGGADFTGNGAVGMLDLLIMIENWLEISHDTCVPADLSQDGTVNILDLVIFADYWLQDR